MLAELHLTESTQIPRPDGRVVEPDTGDRPYDTGDYSVEHTGIIYAFGPWDAAIIYTGGFSPRQYAEDFTRLAAAAKFKSAARGSFLMVVGFDLDGGVGDAVVLGEGVSRAVSTACQSAPGVITTWADADSIPSVTVQMCRSWTAATPGKSWSWRYAAATSTPDGAASIRMRTA